MDKKTVIVFVVGLLVGVIAAPQLHALPVLNKLP